jgi:hypothetical protein
MLAACTEEGFEKGVRSRSERRQCSLCLTKLGPRFFVARSFSEYLLPERVGLAEVAAFGSQGRQVAAGEMAVGSLVDAIKTAGTLQRQIRRQQASASHDPPRGTTQWYCNPGPRSARASERNGVESTAIVRRSCPTFNDSDGVARTVDRNLATPGDYGIKNQDVSMIPGYGLPCWGLDT